MKKRNGLRAAAMAAGMLVMAAGAHAQSSVTLYGVMDAWVGSTKGATTGVKATDKKVTGLNAGGMATSHWGIRGTEDLGGGNSAFFELSSFIRNDTGAPGRNDGVAPLNIAADPYFSRASYLGLRNAKLGSIRLGNMTTPLFVNSITSNAFGGSMVFSPLNVVSMVGSPMSGGTGWADTITYDSPRWGGVSFTVAKSFSETRGGGNTGARVAYADGPLSLGLAWQSVNKDPKTFADGTSWNNTKTWQLAASYDFKVVKLFGHYGRIKDEGDPRQTVLFPASHNVWELSLAVPVGQHKILFGHANRSTSDAVAFNANSVGNVKRRMTSLAYEHTLSKRTSVYAIAYKDNTESRTAATGPNVKASGSNFGFGLKHAF
ncbi:MAG: porin [Comamonas sp.]